MGICVSTPNVKFSEKALETTNEQRLSDSGQRGESLDKAIAPVRVFRDEKVCSISKHSIHHFLHIFASSFPLSQRLSRAYALVLHSLTCTQEMGIALRPTKSGAIIFDVAKHTLDEAAEAAEEFQVADWHVSTCLSFSHFPSWRWPCQSCHAQNRDGWLRYLPQSLQASLQDEGAGTKELENLKLLESMGLEVSSMLPLSCCLSCE